MNYNYNKIPKELKSLKRWVLWKAKKLENGKTTKIPVNAATGYGAKSNDNSTWVTYDEAVSKIEFFNCDGLGFMLGNGYFGIDIDHAIDNKELIDEFVNSLKSYTEKSQSGEGIHIICKGVLPVGNRRKGNIEMYDNVRFFVMTGNTIVDYGIEDRTNEVKILWNKYLNDSKEESKVNPYTYEDNRNFNVSVNLSNAEIISKAIESKNGSLFNLLYHGQWEGVYKSQSEADAALCCLLAFWTGKNALQMDDIFRNSGLYREKWDTKRGNKTYGQIVIENAISTCREVYNPVIHDNNTVVYNPITGEINTKKDYDLTDTGNAQRFIDKFGENIRYNFDNQYWMIWDGTTWVFDDRQIVKSKVDLLIDEMKSECLHEVNELQAREMFKNVKHLSSNSGKEAMLKEAMHIGKTPVMNIDFDKDIWKLNCKNGVVDLKTGELLPHKREYMMSKNTHIDIDLNKEPTTWIKFMNDIFLNNPHLVNFVHKALGYSLTGSTKEQCFFQCYGTGSNGKTVFFNTLYSIFGDYILNAQVDSILTRGKTSGANASPDIARMNGARFVRTNEPEEGMRFNEGLVKQLTGGDVITARFLWGRDFEFKTILKLWIACNYKIVVRGTDTGIWRRQRLIPFNAKFEGKNDDKNMEEKLKQEISMILGWCVKGCLKWQDEGLTMPEEVDTATKDYRQEMDIIASFCKDNIKIVNGGREKASDVYTAYKRWAMNGNEWAMSQSKFGVEMKKRFEKKDINGYVYYYGFVLKENDTSYTYDEYDAFSG